MNDIIDNGMMISGDRCDAGDKILKNTAHNIPEPMCQGQKTKRKVMMDTMIAEKYYSEGRWDEGFAAVQAALEEDPTYWVAVWLQCQYYLHKAVYGMAYVPLKALVEANPGMAEAWNNFGSVCLGLQRLDEAAECFKRAIRVSPSLRAAYCNSALLAIHNADWIRAEAFALKAFSMFSDEERTKLVDWDISETYSYSLLARSRFGEGWDMYDRMVGRSKCRPVKPLRGEPYWDGTKGKKIYVRGEQGMGDEIHFSSILEEACRDNDVVFDCDRQLYGLFKRSFPFLAGRIHPTRKEGPKPWVTKEYVPDAHCLVGTFAKYYRRNASDFPSKAWLVPDPERCLQWRTLFDTMPGMKIGIAWEGGLKRTFRSRRSLTLDELAPLWAIPGVTWVSLAYDMGAEDELERFNATNKYGVNIRHFSRAVRGDSDYDDTAALVNELDLVVSVPTAVVHLAGAIGKKTIVMMPEKARWFYHQYQEGTTKSIWYPDVTMNKQRGKDWRLDKIAHDIQELKKTC